MMSNKKTKKVVLPVDNDELFDEIMRKKRERKQRRDERTKTIKIEKLKEIEINEGKKVNNDKINSVDKNEKFKENLNDTIVVENKKELEDTFHENKSKVLPPSYTGEITETIDISEIIKLQNKSKFKIIFLLPILIILISIFIIACFLSINRNKINEVDLYDIVVNSYDKVNDKVNVLVMPSIKQDSCVFTEEIASDVNVLDFKALNGGGCEEVIDRKKYYVYFKNKDGIVSEPLEVNNYVVSLELKDNYYVTVGKEVKLDDNLITVGDAKINWFSNDKEIKLASNVYVSNEDSNVTITALDKNKKIAETNIYTTSLIVNMPHEFDTKKEYLGCKRFSKEEADLLDKILDDRIKSAGEGTRAGAVAAARFLTLEFPYKISYYFENGRVNNTGVHFVDGEGRYYHKGLYLNESKYEDIVANFFGPATWGCPLVTYEDDPPNFIPGRKYPNGLDCSGFVSWSIYNGGFDIGDIGANLLANKGQNVPISTAIKSGKIKVGDLFNISGHISILIGDDGTNYYVAESLNTYKGLIVKKYNRKNVYNYFTHVTLMDSYYNGDGNLTNMWY